MGNLLLILMKMMSRMRRRMLERIPLKKHASGHRCRCWLLRIILFQFPPSCLIFENFPIPLAVPECDGWEVVPQFVAKMHP